MCFLLLNVQLCSLDKVNADKLNLLYVLNGANHCSRAIRANVLWLAYTVAPFRKYTHIEATFLYIPTRCRYFSLHYICTQSVHYEHHEMIDWYQIVAIYQAKWLKEDKQMDMLW